MPATAGGPRRARIAHQQQSGPGDECSGLPSSSSVTAD